MLARLNMNEIPIYKWKGKTFQQITSNIQMNTNSNTNMYNLRMAQPLKIYRREIVSKSIKTCTQKHVRFDEMNSPNGYIISTAPIKNGLIETLDFNYVNNSTEHPGTCNALSSKSVCLNPAQNALNRVRSSGNIKRNYNVNANNDTYYTSTKQYLESRNRAFSQNQYNYIRSGDSTMMPGSAGAIGNVYSPQGLNHCAKYHVSHQVTFSYQWAYGTSADADATIGVTSVIIPVGSYNVDDVNQILKNTMVNNGHYYTNIQTTAKVFLLNISYNSITNLLELHTFVTNLAIFPSASFTPASGSSIHDTSYCPFFNIDSAGAAQLFGIAQGKYPNTTTTPLNTATSYINSSTFKPLISPSYVPLYYKPNNSQYAQQGAVSASSKITRLKYNTMSTNALKYRASYGNAVANASAYGGSDYIYTLKAKIGYPNVCTPIIDKYTGKMKTKTCGPKMYANR